MGTAWSSMLSWLGWTKKRRIIIIGLDNAGKTSILYRLKLGKIVPTAPTVGFNLEKIQTKGIELSCWDLGGQSVIRPYWRSYTKGANAVVFVADSSDTSRFDSARRELENILKEPELARVPLLVFANKKDVPGSAPGGRVSVALGLPKYQDRPWAIFETSAVKGDGSDIREGLDWLVGKL
ncbi:Small GTPase superfamily, ARF/SAR type like protein [Aduncisulcus paluster]|uniref:Small GTPase superfamily, ARF/SAR type like protein n=1 Tax=Aduncisulcus paluster TaxID=2918883 RepID=A0ABQ5JZS9_9EUKA|nr:Small GTPase superfamily, ARF/SAR type like protein [Aduncisulcus paluster]